MKARHIIIEGPDGTGKTTLAKALCEGAGYAYRHEGPPPAGVTAYQHYAGILDRLEQPTLLDRFHLGELVYGPLLRGKSGLSAIDARALQVLVEAFNVQVILCMPPLPVALANWQERSRRGQEMFADPIIYASSFIGFHSLRHSADVIFDYTRDPVDLDWLTTVVRRTQCRAS